MKKYKITALWAVILFFVSSIMHFSHILLTPILIELLKFSCLSYKFFYET